MNISFRTPLCILLLSIAFSTNLSAQQPERNPFSQNSAVSQSPQGYTKEGVFGHKAMVVSAHPLASQIGAEILRHGGNAFDATVAVQFALAVAFPVAGNIGGGGFIVARMANGKTISLDFREAAPMNASRDMYLDSAGNVVPRLSTFGHKASGVPGTVDAMVQLHKKYGKLPWKALVQPAVDIARHGVFLTVREAEGLNEVREALELYNPGKAYFCKPDKSPWRAGDKLVQEDLANTLERIRDKGRNGFYRGKTAELLVAEMKRGGGYITQQDLDAYSAKWRTPLRGSYRGHNIITMPPPSAGGVGLLQMLTLLEAQPLKEWGVNTEKSAHCMIEIERRVYADRAEYLGDPDFYNVPMKGLLDAQYLRSRMSNYSPEKATPSTEITYGKDVRSFGNTDQTTHFSIVDPAGNVVALTTTLNGGYGSKIVVDGAGFFMNNEMDDFSVKPGAPNMFGAIGGEANAIQPRKRMLSSMTPTIVEKNGNFSFAIGTPGGTTITTSVLQGIINIIDHNMTAQQAVNTKRFHHQYVPDIVRVEQGAFTSEVESALQRKGHTFRSIGTIGKLEIILRRADGSLEGAADPRGDDMAVGF
ncbi:MAG: gamma-glutamyltransferase [Ignavibacteria bacterium]|nr:gamma-glutamyltransferase [Ignavibacteria bacterium]